MSKKEMVGTIAIIGNYQEDLEKSFVQKGIRAVFINIDDLNLENTEKVKEEIDIQIYSGGDAPGLLGIMIGQNSGDGKTVEILASSNRSVARQGLSEYLRASQESGIPISTTVAHPGYINCETYEKNSRVEEQKLKDMLSSKVNEKVREKAETPAKKLGITFNIGRKLKKEFNVKSLKMSNADAKKLQDEARHQSTDFVGKFTSANKDKLIKFVENNLGALPDVIEQIDKLESSERQYANATATNLDKYYWAIDNTVMSLVQVLGIRPGAIYELNPPNTTSATKKDVRLEDIENITNLISIQNAQRTGHFEELMEVISNPKSSVETVAKSSIAAVRTFFNGRKSYAIHSERVTKFSYLLADKYRQLVQNAKCVENENGDEKYFVEDKGNGISHEVYNLSDNDIKNLMLSAAFHDNAKSGEISKKMNERCSRAVKDFNSMMTKVPEDKRAAVFESYIKLYREAVAVTGNDGKLKLVSSASINPRLMESRDLPDLEKMETDIIAKSNKTLGESDIRTTISALKNACYIGMPRALEENVADLNFESFIKPYINPHDRASGENMQYIIDELRQNSILETSVDIIASHHTADSRLSKEDETLRIMESIVHASDVYVATGLEGDVRAYNAMASRANEGVDKAYEFAITQARLDAPGVVDPVVLIALKELASDLKERSKDILGVDPDKENMLFNNRVTSDDVWRAASEMYNEKMAQLKGRGVLQEGGGVKAARLVAREIKGRIETMRREGQKLSQEEKPNYDDFWKSLNEGVNDDIIVQSNRNTESQRADREI